MAISTGKASLAELNSILGTEDLEDLIEIIVVDAHNARVARRNREGE